MKTIFKFLLLQPIIIIPFTLFMKMNFSCQNKSDNSELEGFKAKALIENENSKIIYELKGQEIIDRRLKYIGPYDELEVNKNSNINHITIPWKDIKEDEGTGIVHIAPGCGSEDFILGKEFNLTTLCPIDENGQFLPEYGLLSGQKASQTAQVIIQDLEKKEILFSRENL